MTKRLQLDQETDEAKKKFQAIPFDFACDAATHSTNSEYKNKMPRRRKAVALVFIRTSSVSPARLASSWRKVEMQIPTSCERFSAIAPGLLTRTAGQARRLIVQGHDVCVGMLPASCSGTSNGYTGVRQLVDAQGCAGKSSRPTARGQTHAQHHNWHCQPARRAVELHYTRQF